MIIDRREFKELKSEGGGLLKAISAVAKFEHGVIGIKKGTSLTLHVMKNGAFINVSFNKKIYFEFKDIKNVDVSGYNLTLNIEENGSDCEILLRISNVNDLKKVYMGIREYCKLKYIPEKDVLNKLGKNKIRNDKEAEKECKRKEFERIMASNPEVTVSRTQSVKATEKDRISNMQKQGIPYCPKCHSASIHYIENRKRLSVGRTIVGGAVGSLINPIGTIAGAAMGGLTSNKQKKGTIKCLNCGHTWKK